MKGLQMRTGRSVEWPMRLLPLLSFALVGYLPGCHGERLRSLQDDDSVSESIENLELGAVVGILVGAVIVCVCGLFCLFYLASSCCCKNEQGVNVLNAGPSGPGTDRSKAGGHESELSEGRPEQLISELTARPGKDLDNKLNRKTGKPRNNARTKGVFDVDETEEGGVITGGPQNVPPVHLASDVTPAEKLEMNAGVNEKQKRLRKNKDLQQHKQKMAQKMNDSFSSSQKRMVMQEADDFDASPAFSPQLSQLQTSHDRHGEAESITVTVNGYEEQLEGQNLQGSSKAGKGSKKKKKKKHVNVENRMSVKQLAAEGGMVPFGIAPSSLYQQEHHDEEHNELTENYHQLPTTTGPPPGDGSAKDSLKKRMQNIAVGAGGGSYTQGQMFPNNAPQRKKPIQKNASLEERVEARVNGSKFSAHPPSKSRQARDRALGSKASPATTAPVQHRQVQDRTLGSSFSQSHGAPGRTLGSKFKTGETPRAVQAVKATKEEKRTRRLSVKEIVAQGGLVPFKATPPPGTYMQAPEESYEGENATLPKNHDKESVKERIARQAKAAGGGVYNAGIGAAAFGGEIIKGFEKLHEKEKKNSTLRSKLPPGGNNSAHVPENVNLRSIEFGSAPPGATSSQHQQVPRPVVGAPPGTPGKSRLSAFIDQSQMSANLEAERKRMQREQAARGQSDQNEVYDIDV